MINGFLDPVTVEIEFRIDVVVVVLQLFEVFNSTTWPVVKHSLIIRKNQNGITINFIKWWCSWTVGWLGGAAAPDTFVVGVVAVVVAFCDFSGPIFSTLGWNRFSCWTEIGEIFENWTWTAVWTLLVAWTFSNTFSIFVEAKISAIGIVLVAFDDTLLK